MADSHEPKSQPTPRELPSDEDGSLSFRASLARFGVVIAHSIIGALLGGIAGHAIPEMRGIAVAEYLIVGGVGGVLFGRDVENCLLRNLWSN